ncbi:LANO_0E01464g1_1 [Lachancea nothofagi CBS 11611]|uniref:Purine nucleoside phosphorylase n=1 Tax=Lachancea nothofagi CBS 11611 TaxID=1266666 RepID=A0A1G4JPC4_9SACH|nr:LANO_0E01464g1_1 [Lachancea nothofagi CBS 11611]
MSVYDIDEERLLIGRAVEYIKHSFFEHFTRFEPRTLIICGSGLGGVVDKVASNPQPLSISYEKIPGFKASTVAGHQGKLVFGYMQGSPVVLMCGRLHYYEGHAPHETVFPIRVLNELGCVKNLIVTNACGSVNPNYRDGDLMCLNDHINMPGLAGQHPLRGPNFEEYGSRFQALSDAYDLEFRKLLFAKRSQLGMDRPLHEGVYTYVSGPTFETRAEARMIRLFGGDVVGMSTVPEVIVARHCGIKVLALSLITNQVVTEPPASALDANPIPISRGKATHEEVLEAGFLASVDVERLIEAVVSEL